MEKHKHYAWISTTEDMKSDILKAIPLLEKVAVLTEGNEYLVDIHERSLELLDNAEMCKDFDIWDKRTNVIADWAYIAEVNAIAGKEDRIEFDPPKKLLRIGFSLGAYTFGNGEDKKYYNQFREEIIEAVAPDYDFWGDDMFYDPEHARAAVEATRRILKKYQDNAYERKKVFIIEQKEAERRRLEREIAELKGESI